MQRLVERAGLFYQLKQRASQEKTITPSPLEPELVPFDSAIERTLRTVGKRVAENQHAREFGLEAINTDPITVIATLFIERTDLSEADQSLPKITATTILHETGLDEKNLVGLNKLRGIFEIRTNKVGEVLFHMPNCKRLTELSVAIRATLPPYYPPAGISEAD